MKMMRFHRHTYSNIAFGICIIVILLTLFSSCDVFLAVAPTVAKGSLHVHLPIPSGLKTILPTISMEVVEFEIVGDGPGSDSFVLQGITSSPVTIDDLVVGSWTVTINALNENGILIGTDQQSTLVTAGGTSVIPIEIVPLTESGTLSITLTWPSGMLSNPSVAADLTPVDGSPSPLLFGIGVNTATYTGSWDGGYYVLSIRLLDNGTPVWGKTDAVRIVTGQATYKDHSIAY